MKKIYLMYPQKIGTIAPEIYGHFTEHIGGVIYDGIWVGKDSDIPNVKGFRTDIIEKLKAIKAPVIRWPGGCFAETYDWRDGIGEDRPTRINWWWKNDGKYEPNTVGTHEFMDFCEAVGADAYFAANLTSVTPLHIRDWMDYCLSPKGSTTLALEREKNGHPEPFNIPFWGVGNENWGGGGNMQPEYYANEFRRFATVMMDTAPNAQLFMCGSNAKDYNWTHKTVENVGGRIVNSGFAMHYYCGNAGDPVAFTEAEWTRQLIQASEMEEIIRRNWSIICAHGEENRLKLVIDEWGCWHPDGSGPSKGGNLFEQQSTMRDAMVTALTLNIFNNNCEKIKMANVAQLVNNLHALFLSCGEKCITTPTYHVYDMFKEHQGAECIGVTVTENEVFEDSISVSASVKNGKTLVTIGNLSCSNDASILLEGVGAPLPVSAEMTVLYNDDMHAHNTFETPDKVHPVTVSIDPSKEIKVPKAAVISLSF
jgi:alpha-N-arabinofuranosidase